MGDVHVTSVASPFFTFACWGKKRWTPTIDWQRHPLFCFLRVGKKAGTTLGLAHPWSRQGPQTHNPWPQIYFFTRPQTHNKPGFPGATFWATFSTRSGLKSVIS